MAIPGFQDVMLPMLEELAVGEGRQISALANRLADRLGLDGEQRAELQPSGKQTTFANRTHWAATYLVKAGILTRPRRGWVAVTDGGREGLRENPDRIDLAFLTRYPEIVEFRSTRRSSAENSI